MDTEFSTLNATLYTTSMQDADHDKGIKKQGVPTQAKRNKNWHLCQCCPKLLEMPYK
jgi:hypothetical protein